MASSIWWAMKRAVSRDCSTRRGRSWATIGWWRAFRIGASLHEGRLDLVRGAVPGGSARRTAGAAYIRTSLVTAEFFGLPLRNCLPFLFCSFLFVLAFLCDLFFAGR